MQAESLNSHKDDFKVFETFFRGMCASLTRSQTLDGDVMFFTPVTDNPKRKTTRMSRILHFMKHDSLLLFAVSSS